MKSTLGMCAKDEQLDHCVLVVKGAIGTFKVQNYQDTYSRTGLAKATGMLLDIIRTENRNPTLTPTPD